MRRGRPSADLAHVSRAAAEVMAARHGQATVNELAAAAGISSRTFHRHFPNKEDVLRPLFHEGGLELAAELAARPLEESAVEAFLAAWNAVAGGPYTERTRSLMPLVIADARLTAMWEHEMRVTVASLVPALAARLGTTTDAAEAVATTFVAQMRLAVDRSITRGTDASAEMSTQFADLERQEVFGVPGGRSRAH